MLVMLVTVGCGHHSHHRDHESLTEKVIKYPFRMTGYTIGAPFQPFKSARKAFNATVDIPEKAVKLGTDTLQEGEVTGHRHRLEGDFDILLEKGHKYVNAKSELELVHEEHNTIQIPIGKYVLFQEREFDLFDELYKEVLD